jgi:hypothetical protein
VACRGKGERIRCSPGDGAAPSCSTSFSSPSCSASTEATRCNKRDLPVLRAFDEGVEGKAPIRLEPRVEPGGPTAPRATVPCLSGEAGAGVARGLALVDRRGVWRCSRAARYDLGGGAGAMPRGLGLRKRDSWLNPKSPPSATEWKASSSSRRWGEPTACRGELRQCVLRPCHAAGGATLFSNTAGLLASMTVSCV